jgi:hypothetical protein
MLILERFKGLAQLIGFATIAMLAVYGGVAVLHSARSAWAAEAQAQVSGAAAVDADVPYLVNYQGTLRDGEGTLLTGVYSMTLRIYAGLTDPVTQAVYTATYPSVTVRNGHFSVLLGDPPNRPLPSTLFTNPDRSIGVTVAGYDEMAPRQRFASVPYAIQADRAFALDGRDAAPYTAVWMDAGKVRIGNKEAFNPPIAANDDAQVTIENQANDRWGMVVSSTGGGSSKGLKVKTGYQGHPTLPLFQASAGFGADEHQRFVIEANGNVGIGNQVPEAKLDIRGDGAPQLRLGDSSGDWQLWGGGDFRLRRGKTDRLVIDNDGNVSIPSGDLTANALSSTGGLSVAGNANVTGALTAASLRGRLAVSEEQIADSSTGPVRLMRRNAGLCFLTTVGGVFEYESRAAKVYVDKYGDPEEDWWFLYAGPAGVRAGARCVIFFG